MKTRTTVHSILVRRMSSDVIMDGVSLNRGNATMKMVIKTFIFNFSLYEIVHTKTNC